MFPSVTHAPTLIEKQSSYVTEINFLHIDPTAQGAIELLVDALENMTTWPGFIAANVLRSNDGSRVCTYLQWQTATSLQAARQNVEVLAQQLRTSGEIENDARPRLYTVVYADDHSDEGVSVISPEYHGAIFINEITTAPGTQDRLLELVIANNEIQSVRTPGYRSANFHKSHDGERAVNYSLWDTEEQCIAAISSMADMDENLDETVEIANPDFRFYTLIFAAHV